MTPVTKPKARDRSVLEQNKFWDVVNAIEMPLVLLCQKIFFARNIFQYHFFCEKLLSSRAVGFLSLAVYSLGFYEQSQNFSKSLLFYALFSSFGKHYFTRKRPCHYTSQVYCEDPAPTSSFPSRHSISVVVVSQLIPYRNLRIGFIVFMVVNRMILGLHFLTDCIGGVLLGYLSIEVGKMVEDLDLIIVLLISALFVWYSCARIIGGILPVLVAKRLSCNPLCFFVALSKFAFVKILNKKLLNPSTRYESLVFELLVSALATFLVAASAPYVQMLVEQSKEALNL